MNNQIMLVGRLTQNGKLDEIEGKKVCNIILAVPRCFKNEEGIYETDFIPVTIPGNIAKSTTAYCKKGDLIGIRGRIQSVDGSIKIIADKVSFLATRKEND